MKHFRLALPVLVLFFFSCNNSAESTAGNKDTVPKNSNAKIAQLTEAEKEVVLGKYYALENALNVDTTEKESTHVGQEVDMKFAKECIDFYEKSMPRHGIDNNGRRDINVGTIPSQQITTHEEFAGRKLLNWMDSMVNELTTLTGEDKGKDVRFEMHLGMYTGDFLDEYVKDKDKKDLLRDRITIFVIPRRKITGQAGADELNSRKAYELGNLKP